MYYSKYKGVASVMSGIQQEIQKFWKWAGITPDEYAVYGMTNTSKEEFEYGEWDYLINYAVNIISLMKEQDIDECHIENLLLILALDNECERILDILKESFAELLKDNKIKLLLYAVGSDQYNTRWQIADLLGNVKEQSLVIYLRCFINDIQPYVQRRALLSLLRVDKNEAMMFFSALNQYGDDITKRIISENSSI